MKEKVVVMLPCYNEEITIGQVVKEFKKELPSAVIYVYNNNSTDKTAKIATEAGAIVIDAPIQGKGAVVKQMFNELKADCYIMADGDLTYPAKYSKKMVELVLNKNYDMVIGDRLSTNYYKDNKRPFHGFGNSLVKRLVNVLFHGHIKDIMTGYRAFSPKFINTIGPELISQGFQIETEMTIRALKHKMRIKSVPIEYRDRPEGSKSKLSTIKDGIKVVMMILKLRLSKK